jgi:TonB family protein
MNDSIYSFVRRNFIFPEDAIKSKKEGRIFVSFIIEKDGSVSNVVISRGVSRSLNAEAIRVIQALPQFEKPAYSKGEAVRSLFVIPINAKLQ